MSEKTDRRITGDRLLLGVLIIMFALVATGGIMLWLRKSEMDPSPEPVARKHQMALAHRDEPFSVTFYYPYDGMLAVGSAAIKRQPDAQSQAREALSAMYADQRASLASVLRDLKLRAFYLDSSGAAYIDLTPGLQKDIRASAGEELLAVYAMVNTLLQNFEEIKQVSLLIDGREAQTLAGHIDLTRKFTKRMDLVRQ